MRYARDGMSSQKAHGFVSTHEAVCSSIHKHNGIRLQRLREPCVGCAYSTCSAGFDGKNRSFAEALSQPAREMHFRKILRGSRLRSDPPECRSRILRVTEAKRS